MIYLLVVWWIGGCMQLESSSSNEGNLGKNHAGGRCRVGREGDGRQRSHEIEGRLLKTS